MSDSITIHNEAIIIDPCVQYLISRTDRSDKSGLTAVGLTIPMPGDDMAAALPRVQYPALLFECPIEPGGHSRSLVAC